MSRKTIIIATVIISIIAIIAFGATTAVADKKVDVDISGSPLNLVIPGGDVSLSAITLDGTDQSSTGALGIFKVIDPRGTGAGWYLTMISTDFKKVGEPSKTIPSGAGGFAITNANYTVISGNGGVIASTGNLAPAALTVLDGPSPSGRGANQIDPDVELQIPAETYIGTYEATVTATLISY